MIPLRLLKKAVFDKFDKDNDFDPSLKHFRYEGLDGTTKNDYPYLFYQFNTENDRLAMGDKVPVVADNILTFHFFSYKDQVSTEIEDLMYDLTDKLANNPELDVEQYSPSDNWKNPTLGIMSQNVVEEPETNNWHGMVRYRILMGR